MFVIVFWLKLNFQDSVGSFTEYLNFFHDCNLLVLLGLLTFIFCFMVAVFFSGFFKMVFVELESVEVVWTFLPCVILLVLGWPSLQLLYSLETMDFTNFITVKIIGHQWYWSYDYSNFGLQFDSFMVPESELSLGGFRLLEVDGEVVLPMAMSSRVLVVSADVLHSWALPPLGIKLDANPGRLNQGFIMSEVAGGFYGQCSELCGVNHSFMPINVEFTSPSLFLGWAEALSSGASKCAEYLDYSSLILMGIKS